MLQKGQKQKTEQQLLVQIQENITSNSVGSCVLQNLRSMPTVILHPCCKTIGQDAKSHAK